VDLRGLSETGFSIVDAVEEGALPSVAAELGTIRTDSRSPAPLRAISPSSSGVAKTNTLSSRFGFGAFPFHTDAAHWRQPARYLLLFCIQPGAASRTTALIDTASWILPPDEVRRLCNEVWRIGLRNPYLGTVARFINRRIAIRFDRACMTPLTAEALRAHQMFLERLADSDRVDISWAPGRLLVVDNHRMLHARNPAAIPDPDRILVRALIGS